MTPRTFANRRGPCERARHRHRNEQGIPGRTHGAPRQVMPLQGTPRRREHLGMGEAPAALICIVSAAHSPAALRWPRAARVAQRVVAGSRRYRRAPTAAAPFSSIASAPLLFGKTAGGEHRVQWPSASSRAVEVDAAGSERGLGVPFNSLLNARPWPGTTRVSYPAIPRASRTRTRPNGVHFYRRPIDRALIASGLPGTSTSTTCETAYVFVPSVNPRRRRNRRGCAHHRDERRPTCR